MTTSKTVLKSTFCLIKNEIQTKKNRLEQPLLSSIYEKANRTPKNDKYIYTSINQLYKKSVEITSIQKTPCLKDPFNGPSHPTPSHQRGASGTVGVGLSLDPEGRKRLRGSSFALKSRVRSFLDFQLLLIIFSVISIFLDNFVFFNFPQFVPRGEVICDHHNFWPFSAPHIRLKISKFQK